MMSEEEARRYIAEMSEQEKQQLLEFLEILQDHQPAAQKETPCATADKSTVQEAR